MPKRNIYDWLDEVHARPRMYLEEGGALRDLEKLTYGYYAALSAHAILEDVPSVNHHFGAWLRYRTRWSLSCGWARAIEEHAAPGENPLERFFDILHHYRKLRPRVLATALLAPRHQPTGKRTKIGMCGLMDRPERVDIVRYVPRPIHFLRFYYHDHITDGHALYTSDGSYKTTIADARSWAEDELGVTPADWMQPDTNRPRPSAAGPLPTRLPAAGRRDARKGLT